MNLVLLVPWSMAPTSGPKRPFASLAIISPAIKSRPVESEGKTEVHLAWSIYAEGEL